jgi:hypothetical protein
MRRIKPRCYIVVGPFRSGTSLIARVLTALGIYPGPEKDLFEATAWNPSGYFQRPDITQFNTGLIKQAGFDLTRPGNPADIVESSERSNFTSLDLTWMEGHGDVLIKDPRFSYTLSTWLHHGVLDTFDVHLVRISRDIEDASRSALMHYDVKYYCEESMTVAREVLEKYACFAKWHCDTLSLPALHVEFEKLVTDSLHVITEIAGFVGVHDSRLRESALSKCYTGKSEIIFQEKEMHDSL